jgi:hypothetical protein
MSDDQDSPFDEIVEAAMKALSEAGAKARAKEAGALFLKQGMGNLERPHREARRKDELEDRYQCLSNEEWNAVLDDLKEHLKLTELLNRPTKGMKIQ